MLCRLFGFTRQGLWKQGRIHYVEEIENTAIINEVKDIRKHMPRLGVRKLQVLLSSKGHNISRDKLFDILRDSGMLVKRSHTRVVTTYSRHWMKKWPNLIKEIIPSRPNEIWVSDITYIEIWNDKRAVSMERSFAGAQDDSVKDAQDDRERERSG